MQHLMKSIMVCLESPLLSLAENSLFPVIVSEQGMKAYLIFYSGVHVAQLDQEKGRSSMPSNGKQDYSSRNLEQLCKTVRFGEKVIACFRPGGRRMMMIDVFI